MGSGALVYIWLESLTLAATVFLYVLCCLCLFIAVNKSLAAIVYGERRPSGTAACVCV